MLTVFIFNLIVHVCNPFFNRLVHNALPVKPSAVATFTKQKTLVSIGFTGMLATDRIILSLEGLLPLKEVGVF